MVPSHLEMDEVNLEADGAESDAGHMEYQITYPGGGCGFDCNACRWIKLRLQIRTLIPDFGVFFGGANIENKKPCV